MCCTSSRITHLGLAAPVGLHVHGERGHSSDLFSHLSVLRVVSGPLLRESIIVILQAERPESLYTQYYFSDACCRRFSVTICSVGSQETAQAVFSLRHFLPRHWPILSVERGNFACKVHEIDPRKCRAGSVREDLYSRSITNDATSWHRCMLLRKRVSSFALAFACLSLWWVESVALVRWAPKKKRRSSKKAKGASWGAGRND